MSYVRILFATFLLNATMLAQSVSPVIVEYKRAGTGKIALTNNTQTPMAVTLQPKSFDITPEGKGKYRPLDPTTHLKLSATSVRLQPGQTYYVFYKATADKYPAWFTIYSVFSAPRHENGIDVRIMLPHTVYLFQPDRIQKNDIQIKEAVYNPETHTIQCDLANISTRLGRVQGVNAAGSHADTTSGGFPLLPGGTRHLELNWKGESSPKEVMFQFEHFTVKYPVAVKSTPVVSQ